MDNEKLLAKEFVEKYKKILWPVKIIGLTRFDIKNNEIVQLTFNTLVYRVLLLMIGDLASSYLVYTSIITRLYLKVPDGMVLIHFTYFSNMQIINMSFFNRRSGVELLEQSFKIDSHLGINETKFMRNVGVKIFIFLLLMVALTNISGSTILYMVYDVSLTIHIVGSLYLFWVFFGYVDYCFCLLYATFIAMRVRYLNIALAKIGKVRVEYLSTRSFLNMFFWKKSFDGLVDYECRATLEDYRTAFEMIFKMMHILETHYQFPLGLGFWTTAVGTFVTSNTFIERIKNPHALEQERTYIIIGWAVLSWTFMILVSLFMDLFEQQIEQTKLICACIQLKPNEPAEIYKVAKTLLRLLERRETRLSVYNMFFFDTGFILRMAAATLVYITVQLQLAFPNQGHAKSNVTNNY